MVMGRPTKSIRIKILEGKRGHGPLPTEIVPPRVCDEDDLKNAGVKILKYAQEEWIFIKEELKKMGLYSTVDRGTLASYCSAWARFRLVEERMKEMEDAGQDFILQLNNRTGDTKIHPLFNASIKASTEMVKYASELGLSESSRARIAADKSRAKDKNKKGKFEGLIGINGGRQHKS